MNRVSFTDLFNLEKVNQKIRIVVKNLVWPKKETLDHASIIQHTDYPELPVYSQGLARRNIRHVGGKRHKLTNKAVGSCLPSIILINEKL